MNVTSMTSRVRSTIRDTGAAYISDAEILEWLNEANLEIAARLRLLVEDDTEGDLTETDNYITLPANFLELIELRLGTDDVDMVSDPVWFSWSDAGDTPERSLGRITQSRLYVYPTPSTWDYTIRYYRKPAALSAGADVPEIPERLHVSLVNYARAHALLAMGESSSAETYLLLFDDALPKRRGDDRIWPVAPKQIVPVPNIWDSDPDARHR